MMARGFFIKSSPRVGIMLKTDNTAMGFLPRLSAISPPEKEKIKDRAPAIDIESANSELPA